MECSFGVWTTCRTCHPTTPKSPIKVVDFTTRFPVSREIRVLRRGYLGALWSIQDVIQRRLLTEDRPLKHDREVTAKQLLPPPFLYIIRNCRAQIKALLHASGSLWVSLIPFPWFLTVSPSFGWWENGGKTAGKPNIFTPVSHQPSGALLVLRTLFHLNTDFNGFDLSFMKRHWWYIYDFVDCGCELVVLILVFLWFSCLCLVLDS